MPWRFNQASGFRQQGKYNRTSAAERSEIRREAVHPPPVQDAPPCPDLAHPEFYSKSSVFFPPLSNHPMKNAQVVPGEPDLAWRGHGSYPATPLIHPPADLLMQVEREQIQPVLTRERAGKTRRPQNPINLEIAGNRRNVNALVPEERLGSPHVQRRGHKEHLLPTFSLFQFPELEGLVMCVCANPQVSHARGRQARGCQPILN